MSSGQVRQRVGTEPFGAAIRTRQFDRFHVAVGDLPFAFDLGLHSVLVASVLRCSVRVVQADPRDDTGPKATSVVRKPVITTPSAGSRPCVRRWLPFDHQGPPPSLFINFMPDIMSASEVGNMDFHEFITEEGCPCTDDILGRRSVLEGPVSATSGC